jgi:hypothetical protein
MHIFYRSVLFSFLFCALLLNTFHSLWVIKLCNFLRIRHIIKLVRHNLEDDNRTTTTTTTTTKQTRTHNLIFMFPCIMIQYLKITNKMQMCRIIYYFIVPWLFNMFRARLSFIIRSFWTVIAASGFTQVCRCPQRHTCVILEAVTQFRCYWWWAKISLETCRAAKE